MFKKIIIQQIREGVSGEELINEVRLLIHVDSYFLPKFFHDNNYTSLKHQLSSVNVNRKHLSNIKHTPVAIKVEQTIWTEKDLEMPELYGVNKERFESTIIKLEQLGVNYGEKIMNEGVGDQLSMASTRKRRTGT